MGYLVKNVSSMKWDPSPSPTVFRKRLELLGEKESGQVTSVVKYEKNSSFRSHAHPDGEEILVLEGIFEDNHGKWPAGTYLLNPEGFEHAPSSKDGCVLFVKLKQFPGLDREHVVIDTKDDTNWDVVTDSIKRCQLYPPKKLDERKSNGKYKDTMDLFTLKERTELELENIECGLEVYVINGSLVFDEKQHPVGSWIKIPPDDIPEDKVVTVSSEGGASIYVKRNHLGSKL
eukprot:CAMPEP_0204822464 /NCGR_PEP_ID=MMETSP1346-20131115/651_1 /ASSEMBLY_ACC=CAM_ASM_000771 /TAXON_ID=215587 /ORGANISM="Aplanochytrium stocchinoi, Strain GSBS06" /LENGTH=230 /DNA_ID=CAMNT_0051948675 /DNA_START=289 /DNA_END=981 /DNA_ORIENTATION=-